MGKGDRKVDMPGVVPAPLVYVPALLSGLLLHSAFPFTLLATFFLFPLAIGLPIIGVGVFFLIWAGRTMRLAGTSPNPTKPTTKIVVEGPFRFSRNPIYLSFTLIYLGITIATNALWPLLLLPVVLVIVQLRALYPEEKYLEQRFGEEYLRYKARVRRWI